MSKKQLGKILEDGGRIVALIIAILIILKVLPSTGVLSWGILIICAISILIGNKIRK